VLHRLRSVRGRFREGYYDFLKPRHASRLAYLYALDRVGQRRYRLLSEDELRATRSSDTAFVFGSGRSLVEIEPDEWERIGTCNTISLREFPRQRWVRADYHVTSEVDFLDEYAQRIRENPLYEDTVFVVQGGFQAERGNELVGRALLPPGASVFRFRRTSRGAGAPPSRRFADGLVHGYSSIFDATNLALLLGFRRIVLAGVDLYNKEYFWLPPGKKRDYERAGIAADAPFAAATPIVEMLGDWHDILAREGVRLCVQNPKSLLTRRLPVFSWDGALRRGF
jgi:hypothetical protein